MKTSVQIAKAPLKRVKLRGSSPAARLEKVGQGDWQGVQPDKYVSHLRKNWK